MATENVTVSINDLEDWFSEHRDINKIFKLEITGIDNSNIIKITETFTGWAVSAKIDLSDTVLPNSVTSVDGLLFSTHCVIKSPKLPSNITNLDRAFYRCYGLIESPIIPDTVISMNSCFEDCSELVKSPIIPDTVVSMSRCFFDCYKLVYPALFPENVDNIAYCYASCTLLNYKPIIPNSVTITEGCFDHVPQIRQGAESNIFNTLLSTQVQEFEVAKIEKDIENNCYKVEGDTVYGVNTNNLSTWLSEHDANTTDTPYEIKILNITSPDYPSVRTALLANPTKFVDLGYTVIDYTIVQSGNYLNCTSLVGAPTFGAETDYLDSQFRGCSNLKKVPPLPSSVLSLSITFEGCSSLAEPVEIPSGVTNISYMFLNCVSLQSAPTIPNTVTNMRSAFQGCVLLNDDNIVIPDSVTNMQSSFNGCFSLESIKKIPSSVTVMIDAFYNCASLRKIERFEVPLNTLKNNSNFENAFEGCTSLEQIGYKIDETNWHIFHLHFENNYDFMVDVSGKVYSIDNGTIIEKTIPQTEVTGESQFDELVLTLPDYTDEMWFPVAGEQIENTIQKMLTYKYGVFNKEVLQPDKKNFVLWAQDPNNFQTNLPIEIPVGFIMPQYKKVDAIGWLYLDGRDTTNTADELETVYPALYAYLGNTNVLPDYREFALVGAEENTTDVYNATTNPDGTIQTHDVYSEGQAKDDALQNITGYFQIRKMSNGANAVTSRSGAFTLSDQSSQADGFDFSGGEGKIHRVSFNSKNVTRNDANANVTRGKRKAVYFYIRAV